MRYWWVNQGKTARQELDGGYLWSPKREKGDKRSQFYNNMRIVAPGDKVLSFFDGQIGHAGIALDFAIGAPKPLEFGKEGDYWGDEGWQLPMVWQPLAKRFRPKPLIDQFRHWLPPKYFPINPRNGNGSEKAYLAEICEELFQYLLAQAGGEPRWALVLEPSTSPPTDTADWVSDKQFPYSDGLGDSERDRVVKTRFGQSIFRENVSEMESGCRLTGVTNPTLLTAGHIKPWRSCTSTRERLDGANGLLLTPNADRLFDRGLISFADSGEVLLSPRLLSEDIERLGLQDAFKRNAGTFSNAQKSYLAYHRSEIFLR